MPTRLFRAPLAAQRITLMVGMPDSACYSYIAGLGPFGILNNFELDHLALFQGLEPLALDGGMMDEDIFPAFPVYEPISLLVIEPFYSSFFHGNPLK